MPPDRVIAFKHRLNMRGQRSYVQNEAGRSAIFCLVEHDCDTLVCIVRRDPFLATAVKALQDFKYMSIPTLSAAQLKHALQCAARCDGKLTPEEWLRVFRYEDTRSDAIEMARYDNGAGDHITVFFTSTGKALVKGFDHESEVSPHAQENGEVWPGMYDGLPSDLLPLAQDEAAEYEDVTFCFWSVDGTSWDRGNTLIPDHVDDGSSWLLSMIQMDAVEFIEWARDYYEEGFDLLGESGVFAEFSKGGRHEA
ncbi:hypothetical protein MASSI9I_51185 [Massilia sp. 9I]|nr:hypothetical protein MASSI9I_51185 [Massilia sp. 9I]